MAKRLIKYISIRDTETGKILSKGHHSLMAASDKARKIARKTGRATQVNDEFGVYLKYPPAPVTWSKQPESGKTPNPRAIVPSEWTNAKVRMVRGRVCIQLPIPRRRR